MIIVSGHLQVVPSQRAAYLDTCAEVVAAARAAEGCQDFALSADLIDPGRINILERWDTRHAAEAFRQGGVGPDQEALIIAASVAEYDVAGVRPLT